MATMNISLPTSMKDWIETQLPHGHFSNTSDYMRHLIRKEQERQNALAVFQQAIDEGLASGEPQSFAMKQFIAEMRNTQ